MQKKTWKRQMMLGLAVVLPVAGFVGGLTEAAIHSRRNFNLTAVKLRDQWTSERRQGESADVLASLQKQLQQLESRKIAGVPAVWFASYDGEQKDLMKLTTATTKAWQTTTQQDEQKAQTALSNLEKAMGKFAKQSHAEREQALSKAQTPNQYLQLVQKWNEEQTTWQHTVDKLKSISGGFDGGHPADVEKLSGELTALLKKAPKVDSLGDMTNVPSEVNQYLDQTPKQQLDGHAGMVHQLKKAISEVKRAEAVYREQAGSNPFGTSFVNYLKTRQSEVSVAIYDAKSHKTYTFRPDIHYGTASIVKATIMADLLHQSEVSGKPLTSQERSLMIPMIEQSDNTAASTLWDIAGEGDGVEEFLQNAGMTSTIPGQGPYWGLTSTTVRDQVELMKLYAFPNQLLDNQDREYGLNLMEHVVGWEDWGVSTGAAGHAAVALKNGWSPKTSTDWRINSIGYIDGDGRDYVIAILSEDNPSEAYGIQTVDEVSQLAWEALG